MPRHTAPPSFWPYRFFTLYFMQFVCVFFMASLMAADSVAAQAAVTTNLQSGCVTNYDSTVDYFPEKINAVNNTKVTYAYAKNYKTITNSFSNETIVLYQCGTPKPTVAGATQIIAVPVNQITIGDTTIVTFLELLGLRSAIKYTTSGTSSFISSPCVQALVASGAITDVDAKSDAKAISQIESTDVFFNYFDTYASNVTNSVTFPASADPGVKGRDEWIGFVASFFNVEAKANAVASQIATNFAALAVAANAPGASKPVVAWVTYQAAFSADYPQEWILEYYQYQIDLTLAAGAIPYLPASTDGTSSVTGVNSNATRYHYSTSGPLVAQLANVDIVIDGTYSDVNGTNFYSSFLIPDTSALKFVIGKKVYMLNRAINGANGGTESQEAAIVETNVVLGDLVSVTHPEVVGSAYTPTFLRNVFTDKQNVLTAQSCSDVKAVTQVPVVAVAGNASGSGAATTKTGGAAGANVVFVLAGLAALLI